MEFVKYDELFEQSQALFKEAKPLIAGKDVSAEDYEKGKKMVEEANGLRERSKMLMELEERKAESLPKPEAPRGDGKFNSLGELLQSVHGVTFKGRYDPRLQAKGGPLKAHDGKDGWAGEVKDLTEGTDEEGGFLVFPEYRSELFQMDDLERIIRQRAFVIPMRSNTMTIPSVDQSGTVTDGSSYYGGAIAKWTAEAAQKGESQPDFNQIELTANKLIVYTEASDELLADSAIPLETLIQQLFRSTVLNEEEWAFMNGTGVGQPWGITMAHTGNDGPTLMEDRDTAGEINIVDIFAMLGSFQGRNPIWIAHQSTMPEILSLQDPGNNYVWIGNGRDQQPTTLMGYPIYFVENARTLGSRGDLTLADLSKYVIGDRQMVTIDASKHYRFRYDITSWRAVHRVDGRPWMDDPITYRDGVTQVSPFVILDGTVTT